jgi:hypothetical protein
VRQRAGIFHLGNTDVEPALPEYGLPLGPRKNIQNIKFTINFLFSSEGESPKPDLKIRTTFPFNNPAHGIHYQDPKVEKIHVNYPESEFTLRLLKEHPRNFVSSF